MVEAAGIEPAADQCNELKTFAIPAVNLFRQCSGSDPHVGNEGADAETTEDKP